MSVNKIVLVSLIFTVADIFASPIDKDEPVFACLSYEYYTKCSDVMCHKVCTDLRNPPPCRAVPFDCFNPACLCKDGKLRNSIGDCVPIHECAKDFMQL